MDHRQPLAGGTILVLDGISCRIEKEVGRGSNAIVYKAWYEDGLNPDQRHIVLIKELFPLHPGNQIRRSESGLIQVEPEAMDFYLLHSRSFEEGNRIHLHLLEKNPHILGANLNSYRKNNTCYTMLGYNGGRSFQEELEGAALHSLRQIADLMLGVLDALEAFHSCGYLHLDISPDNIMLMGEKRTRQVFLIDYNSARPIDTQEHFFSSCKPGYSAPEVENHFSSIGIPADLYSVAAVFFRAVMGRELMLTESIRSGLGDISQSKWMRDVPQTVSEMVARILRKGLHTLPQKRYQSIGQMQQAFLELLDRIDCVGVTHWSVWENGRRGVEELIRVNPSLRYLKEENGLYPIRLEQEGSMSLENYLDHMLSPEGRSGLILAQGGMGKTTLLMHTAMLQGKRYSPNVPAVFYISLNGWNGADSQYIRSQILMRLRFKREENTFDSAMHALHQLFQQRLKTRNGELPAMLLLLDGLNEVREDMGPLVQEINELSAMAGVRILAASRSEIPALQLQSVRLMPLCSEDIEAALGRNGLLVPRDPEMLQLLRTPLILSIFIRASEGERQLTVQSQEELMRAYLDALLTKEIRQLPEDSPQRWQIDAALNCILPEIAAEIRRTQGPLSEQQLLKLLEKSWKSLHSRAARKVFPQWIGHSRDIFAEAENAEQWYGIVIHGLLWQRLGMLMKDSGGKYRIFHQIVEAYLAEHVTVIPGEHRMLISVLAVMVCTGMLTGSWLYRADVQKKEAEKQAYLQEQETRERMKEAMEFSAAGYAQFGTIYQQLRELADAALAGNAEGFCAQYSRILSGLQDEQEVTTSEKTEERQMERSAVYDGCRVIWSSSDLVFDYTALQELLRYPDERAAAYVRILPVLKTWVETHSLQQKVPDLAGSFSELLEADADLAAETYHSALAVHLSGADPVWTENINALIALIPEQDAHRDTAVRDDRGQLRNTLESAFLKAEGNFNGEFSKVNAYIRNSGDALPETSGDILQDPE